MRQEANFMRRLLAYGTYGWDITLLLGVMLVATLLNSNWAFSPLEILPIFGVYNDQWVYAGSMLDLSDKLNYVLDTYSQSGIINQHGYILERFSWSVPGAIIYQLFSSPIIANYVLKFGVYTLSVIGLYWALRNLFGRKTGLFAGLCLGSYAWFLRSAGWDYVDGIGIGYFSMTFALMVGTVYAQKSSTWRILSFLTGMMAVNLLLANLHWGFLILHLLFMAVWLNHRQRHRSVLQSIILIILGGLSMAFIYALISYIVRGEWLFIRYTLYSTRHIYWNNLERWQNVNTLVYAPITPHYHVIPALLFLAGIFLWGKKIIKMPVQRIILIQFVWLHLIMIYLHFNMQPYLIMMIYSSYLIPAIFLWLGALVSIRIETLSEKQFLYLLISLVILFLTPFGLSVLFPITETWQNQAIVLIFGIIIILIGLIPLPHMRLGILFAGIILFGWMSSGQIFVFEPDRLEGQETFAMGMDAYEAVQSHYTRNGIRDVQFILNAGNTTDVPMVVPAYLYFDAYYLRGYIQLNEDDQVNLLRGESPFNRISQGQSTQKTVIISRYEDMMETIMTKYPDYDYEVEKSLTIERHGMRFYMDFVAITP